MNATLTVATTVATTVKTSKLFLSEGDKVTAAKNLVCVIPTNGETCWIADGAEGVVIEVSRPGEMDFVSYLVSFDGVIRRCNRDEVNPVDCVVSSVPAEQLMAGAKLASEQAKALEINIQAEEAKKNLAWRKDALEYLFNYLPGGNGDSLFEQLAWGGDGKVICATLGHLHFRITEERKIYPYGSDIINCVVWLQCYVEGVTECWARINKVGNIHDALSGNGNYWEKSGLPRDWTIGSREPKESAADRFVYALRDLLQERGVLGE